MSKKKTETPGVNIVGLLSLKVFERPDAERSEKNVQSTMQAVRAAHRRPSLHLFPDKSLGGIFAQPRYGIAALFMIFLGLHLVRQSMPVVSVPVDIMGVEQHMEMDLAAGLATNKAPPAIPPTPTGRRSYSSLVQPVSFTE